MSITDGRWQRQFGEDTAGQTKVSHETQLHQTSALTILFSDLTIFRTAFH